MIQSLAVFNASSLTDATAFSFLPTRIAGDLLGALGLLALVLAALGIYAVLSVVVQSLTREIRVRVAIGATPQSVAVIVVRQAITCTAAGIALALVVAMRVTRFLAAFLYRISPTHPCVFGGVLLLLSLSRSRLRSYPHCAPAVSIRSQRCGTTETALASVAAR